MNRKSIRNGVTTCLALSALGLLASQAQAQQAAPKAAPQTAAAQSKTSKPPAPAQPAPVQQTQAPADLVALAGPTTITHVGNNWKSSMSTVSLKQGQDVLPLTMTLSNGADGKLKLKGIRIFINGRRIISEADFKGKDSISLNMSDILAGGDTQMEVQTYGSSGSTLTWVVTTPKIKVSEIKPDLAAPGEKVTISGKNLPKTASAYQIAVGKKTATIDSVTDKQINFTMPAGVEGGKQAVDLTIAGVKSDQLFIKVKVVPELSGTNMVACPANSPITIYGKGFAKNANDNIVTFNGQQATVSRVTDTSLEVMVPNLDFPQDGVVIKLKAMGVEAKNTLKQDLSMRTIPKGESIGPGTVTFQE